jgi:hypothetical protein
MIISHCLVNPSDGRGKELPTKQIEVLIVISCLKGKRMGRHEVIAVDRKPVVIEKTAKGDEFVNVNKIVGFRQIKDPRPKSSRGGKWENVNPLQ